MGLNYLDELGVRIRAHVPRADLPNENTGGLFRIYAVLLLAKGSAVTSGDVHNAWAAWMTGLDSDHEALVPFEDLDPAIASDDEPFAEAIRIVARAL
jgi:hypothetical protein